MEPYSGYIGMFSKFSNSIKILGYYGTYAQGRRLMAHLGQASKEQFYANIKAYKFGLSHFRKFTIDIKGTLDKEILEFINRRRYHLTHNIKISIDTEEELLTLLNFLPKFIDAESMQFSEITIPSQFYQRKQCVLNSWLTGWWSKPTLKDPVNNLLEAMQKIGIDTKGIKSDIELNLNRTHQEKLIWGDKYKLDDGWRCIQNMEGLIVEKPNASLSGFEGENERYNEERKIFQMQLEAFNLPVKVLWLNSPDLLKVLNSYSLSEEFKESVEKIIVEIADHECNLDTFEDMPKLTKFNNGDNIWYFNLSTFMIPNIAEIILEAKEKSTKFSLFHRSHSDYSIALEMSNTKGYIKYKNSLIGFKCKKFQLLHNKPSQKDILFFEEYINICDSAMINLIDIENISFMNEYSLDKYDAVYEIFQRGTFGVKSDSIAKAFINQSTVYQFDLWHLNHLENVYVEFGKPTDSNAMFGSLGSFTVQLLSKKYATYDQIYIKFKLHWRLVVSSEQQSIVRIINSPIRELSIVFDKTLNNRIPKKIKDKIYKGITSNRALLKLSIMTSNETIRMDFIDYKDVLALKDMKQFIYDLLYKSKLRRIPERPQNKIEIIPNTSINLLQ